MEVRHIRIERLEKVASLRGSKYVQSTMGMTYLILFHNVMVR